MGICRLPFVLAMRKGDLVRRINEVHIQYGPIVPVAPEDLSFVEATACRDIYDARGHQPRFPKNPMWMGKNLPRANGIVAYAASGNRPLPIEL